MLRLLPLIWGCLLAGDADFAAVTDRPIPEIVTGAPFERLMQTEISVRYANVDVRTVIARLASTHRVAIVRDRRIDPDAEVSFSTVPQPLRQVFDEFAALAQGEARVVGSAIYLGPPAATDKLRTLIALRREELASGENIPGERRRELMRNFLVHWQDLDRPQAMLEQIAAHYGLNILGGERVPHDLWAGGTFVAEDAITALSLILVQFDLTFAWRDQGQAVEIVPVPETVWIVRGHLPGRNSLREAAALVGERFPKLEVRPTAGKLLVAGTVEQQEAVEQLLRPVAEKRPVGKTPAGDDPLANQRFTLRVMGVPALALLRDLQKRLEMRFAIDQEKLAAAGVDLEKKVDVDLKEATIDEYLSAFLDQVGAKFERRGREVAIQPAGAGQ